MKRFLTLLAAATLLTLANGCNHHQLARNGCGNGACGNAACRNGLLGNSALAHRGGGASVPHLPPGYQNQIGPAGPPSAQVAYPYYTTRGPRDYFLNEPPSLGP